MFPPGYWLRATGYRPHTRPDQGPAIEPYLTPDSIPPVRRGQGLFRGQKPGLLCLQHSRGCCIIPEYANTSTIRTEMVYFFPVSSVWVVFVGTTLACLPHGRPCAAMESPAERAGREEKCPACGRQTRVPAPAPRPNSDRNAEQQGQRGKREEGKGPQRARGSPRRRQMDCMASRAYCPAGSRRRYCSYALTASG